MPAGDDDPIERDAGGASLAAYRVVGDRLLFVRESWHTYERPEAFWHDLYQTDGTTAGTVVADQYALLTYRRWIADAEQFPGEVFGGRLFTPLQDSWTVNGGSDDLVYNVPMDGGHLTVADVAFFLEGTQTQTLRRAVAGTETLGAGGC
ncbi:MAG: hypothetical protein R3C49_25660 [Planctomycetaceae bacterium]